MSRTTFVPRLIAIGVATLVLSACSTDVGGSPSPSALPTPDASPSTPIASPEPTAPATPTDSPPPTPEPVVVVRIDTGTIARITADGVAVRVLPGTAQPFIHGYDFEGADIGEVRLDTDDRVAVIWGPVLADGHTWYSVRHVETAEPMIFDEGWVAADFLAEDGRMPLAWTVLTADGHGSGQAVSGEVTDVSPLYVNVVASPMPGDDGCEAEVVLIGTDGLAVTIGTSEVTEATRFFGSPLENGALYQEAAGTVTLQVRSDCSWAGMAFVPVG